MVDVNCTYMGCNICKRAVKIAENKYICESYPKKHKQINARECSAFICKKRDDSYPLCRDCNGHY